ncbi:MAG: LLM class flavin-dependent oxidoreductase [Nitrosopumilaceae archaeon]|nr:LLM class flavin-dependent oxidoreductase [Nitrosopumilaceae archaeon]NIU01573.1 LLM class flavin-dependent oxidoreductase [Nitrosopumilaceae archaeon]NIU88554.1 LLM class flavin-dependent oxidoreductase [Nitrosopumilaceae archaeon]NIV66259.1 LLM class flavin-dependent oxidoreductase [Nitrosopumilaceae archaeon]NIX62175.1 LLM class flavin-dependent oxidoreductase [Nitrosopumilaceae archaeon]
MRVSFSLGSLLTVNEIFECTKILSKTTIDTIWVPETWGMENFSVLSMVSQLAKKPRIGSSIVNVYSRSPALIAMGAATLDTISNKRLVLGLGASSIPIVENFHGYKFEKPLVRMEEVIKIIRLLLEGNKVNYAGEVFNLKNFSLLITPPRKKIPIFMAAVNKKMTELAWKITDGVIFYLRPMSELKDTIKKMQKIRKIETTCQIITSVNQDSQLARDRAKKTLAFYVSVGKVYRNFLAENGYSSETNNIFEEFKTSGLKSNHENVSEKMLDELTISGTPEECKNQLHRFKETGIDLPIIQFNPTGNILESCKLFATTFLGEKK